MKSYQELVGEARAAVTCTTANELKARLDAGEEPILIDVREPEEWPQGIIAGAHTIPRGVLEGQVDRQVPRDSQLVLYCASGGRSALAAKSLLEMGFESVESLDGGFGGWAQAGFPIAQA